MKQGLAVLGLVALVACGGGGSSPTTPATPIPTPTPVSYTGSFSGGMSYTSPDGVVPNVFSTVATTHIGNSLNMGGIQVTSPFVVTFPLGEATLTGDHFDGRGAYQSSGCGPVTSRFVGYFSGDGRIMNLTATFTSAECGVYEIRGEVRR